MASTSDRKILPATVKPLHYDISIYDLEMGGKFAFQGTVKILVQITQSCKEVVLNSHELNILNAEVSAENHEAQTAKDITYNVPLQRCTLMFENALPAAEKVSLVIKFQGTMNDDMVGFYRSTYKPTVAPAASVPKDGENYYQFSTQFEACDARRAFPCFDEPALKATFDVEVELPDDQVALSNMPVKSTRKRQAGLQVVQFERTPIMSTYLLAWALGDFEYIESFTKRSYNGKHLPFRVYTTRGCKDQGQHALSHGPAIIDYFSELFDIDYPLPKMDLLAVHSFSHNAMENWGLVTYRASSLLFNEKTSDEKYRKFIVYVLSHELAHQWFGDLCTMEWWDELWLNEGFATWVGWLAVDHMYPEWNIWEEFVQDSGDRAFQLDSLRSSHPIEVPVRTGPEVDQVFDAISYYKGSFVIRMLAEHLGREIFLKGVSLYLKIHAYGNATTNDLWAGVSEASGQDVKALMDPWILNMGFPVLTIAEEPGQISIRQSRFLSTGDVKPNDDVTTWWVPLSLRGIAGTAKTSTISLTRKQDTVRDVDDSFYKVNTDSSGFYRTNYPPPRLAKLGTQRDRLSGPDKIGLIGDASALAFSGEGTTPALLAFVERFTSETSYTVWLTIINSLNNLQSIFSQETTIASALQAFTLKLISPTVEKIGWEATPGEGYLTSQLRTLLLFTAGKIGHKAVITEARRRFELYSTGKEPAAIPANLRSAIYAITIQHGGSGEYASLKEEWQTTKSLDGKETVIRASGSLQQPDLIADYLSFVFANVAPADVHFAAEALAGNPKTRLPLWRYIQDNFEDIRKRYGGNLMIFDRLFLTGLKQFSDRETEQEIAKFFEDKDTKGYDRTLKILSDTILGRAAYRERDAAVIMEWLQSHGYA